MSAPELSAPARILVAEKIAPAGIALLKERFDVDIADGWSAEELADRIGGYDGILIRSATRLTAELIERGDRLKVIGRAGVGSTTSTSRPPRGAASSSPTLRSPTSSRRPSTRSP